MATVVAAGSNLFRGYSLHVAPRVHLSERAQANLVEAVHRAMNNDETLSSTDKTAYNLFMRGELDSLPADLAARARHHASQHL